jgi:hypothetical protein
MAARPPTGARDGFPGNLPRQLTSFIGRERELQDLKALLERSSLLTLTGPGGSGKTRLSLQLAAEVTGGFPDGVYFVALAPVENPDLVLSSVAQGSGLRDAGDRPLWIACSATWSRRASCCSMTTSSISTPDAHPARDRGRDPGRAGSHQPRHRRPVLPLDPHGRHARRSRPDQTRVQHPDAAGGLGLRVRAASESYIGRSVVLPMSRPRVRAQAAGHDDH